MTEKLRLSDLLIKFRDILGESQKEVAGELGIPPPSLSFYENDERLPSFDVLVKLLEYYDAQLTVETDLGKWIFDKNQDDEIYLNPEDQSKEKGLLGGLEESEKEDLIAYIRRRRRNSSDKNSD